jgi:asparagine synthase (glutamine-hydrolysing)
MCGIAGIVAARPVSPDAVQAMCDLMVHRGPDGEGLWSSPDRRVVFGHRRLAIIDMSDAAAQPMSDPQGRFTLTFNGEIYNYVELAARLRSEGAALASDGDTATLLAAWRHWGPDALVELNGMFGFAVYDAETGLLHAARDRFGEKPFYFAAGDGWFAFASEYKALLALDGVSATIDTPRLARFLHRPAHGLDDGRETVFAGIHQLLPGEVLTLDTRRMEHRIARYWRPRADGAVAVLDIRDSAERFRDLLTDSIRLRMRSDVAQGSCLSGGLDSSSIVCIARAERAASAYHVFTGRFPGTGADEGPFADIVIDATGVTPHAVEPTSQMFADEIATFAWHNELPVGSASQYAQWCVFRLARDSGITVLLDGQGADELLGGYEQFFAIYLADLRARGEAGVDQEEAAIRARYPAALADARQRLSLALPPSLRRAAARMLNRGSDVLFGMQPDAARAVTDAPTPPDRAGGFTGLAAAFHREAFHEHLPTLLRYGDRNSMAHSREVRLPFCDHRLAEFALSLHPRMHMGDAQTKRLLREAMRGVLPDPIRERWNKQGFLPPQPRWFRERLGDVAEDLIEDPAFGAEGLWDRAWWRRALARFRAGEDHLAWTLWRPLAAESWRRHFVVRATAGRRAAIFAAEAA